MEALRGIRSGERDVNMTNNETTGKHSAMSATLMVSARLFESRRFVNYCEAGSVTRREFAEVSIKEVV